jgi:hypothetical protein
MTGLGWVLRCERWHVGPAVCFVSVSLRGEDGVVRKREWAARHKAKIMTPYGPRTCFEARIERDGRQPLVARFGELPLHRRETATVADRQPTRVDYPHKELLTRLLTGTCEICGRTGQVGVHQIRKLKDLAAPGPLQPQWAKAMAKRRRKTLVVRTTCHDTIHARQPARRL